jgi:glucuronosyltransferase
MRWLVCFALCAAALAAAAVDYKRFPTVTPDPGHGYAAPKLHHVVIVTIPFYGHFMPLKAVGEALLERGHNVTILTEKPSWCETPLEHKFNCVVLPVSGAFPDAVLREISARDDIGSTFGDIMEQVLAHQRLALGDVLKAFDTLAADGRPATGVLTDASTLAGYDAAAKYGLPYVSVFPLTLHIQVAPAINVPSLGTGLPRDMTLGQKVLNYIIRLLVPFSMVKFMYTLNDVRAQHGIVPYKNVLDIQGLYGPILAPTVWPYDVPQPLCPNVFPLGTLVPAHEHIALEPELEALLNSQQCQQHGTVYVNFGTLVQQSPRLLSELLSSFTNASFQQCIIWKPNPQHLQTVQETFASSEKARGLSETRVFVRKYLNNPPSIMRHPAVKAFITHCGDTSVGEAIEAHLPLIGIPFFADQADVCQRVSETDMGIYLGHKNKVTAADITTAIVTLSTNASRREQIKTSYWRLNAVAEYLGGAARGAQVAEAHYSYRLGDDLVCAHLNASLLGTVDEVTGDVNTGLFAQLRAVWLSHNYDVLLIFNLVPMWIAFYIVHRIAALLFRLFRRGGAPVSQPKTKKE